MGQAIKSIVPNGETKLDFNIDKSGLYFIQVITAKKNNTRKVIVLSRYTLYFVCAERLTVFISILPPVWISQTQSSLLAEVLFVLWNIWE